MTAVAGYPSTISVGGTSTAMTGEATSLFSGSGANTVRQITNSAKRCLDPAVAVVVKDGAGTVASTSYRLDYLYGKIRFLSYTPSGAITVDANYIPLLPVLGCRAMNINAGRQLLDATVFSNGSTPAGETFILGKKQADGEVDYLENIALDHDSGGGTVSFWGMLVAGAAVVLDAQIGDTTAARGFRSWVQVHGLPIQFDHNSLVGKKVKWKTAEMRNTAGTQQAYWSMAEDTMEHYA